MINILKIACPDGRVFRFTLCISKDIFDGYTFTTGMENSKLLPTRDHLIENRFNIFQLDVMYNATTCSIILSLDI